MRRTIETNLRQEQRKIYRGAAAAFIFCAAIFGAAYLFLPGFIRLPGEDFQSLLTCWAGASLFIVIWIMIGVGMVSSGRRRSPEDIRGSAYSAPSPRIAVQVAFLQNTLEQSIIAMFTQLALILLLGSIAIPLLAASVLLFAVGRVTFLKGYPKGAGVRSFGMAVTAIPSLTAFVIAVGAVISRIWH